MSDNVGTMNEPEQGSRTRPGFAGFDLTVFLFWMAMYAWLGRRLGTVYEFSLLGLVGGLVVGLFPSMVMAQRSHYGSMYPWSVAPALILLLLVPEHYQLWLAVPICLLPLAALPAAVGFNRSHDFPLHRAASSGHWKRVRRMLEGGGDVNQQDEHGWTPLFLAAHRGELQAAEFLLELGADVNLADHQGQTPLHRAALAGRAELVQILLTNGADPDIIDQEGQSPLELAMSTAHYWNTGPEKDEAIRILQAVTTPRA